MPRVKMNEGKTMFIKYVHILDVTRAMCFVFRFTSLFGDERVISGTKTSDGGKKAGYIAHVVYICSATYLVT